MSDKEPGAECRAISGVLVISTPLLNSTDSMLEYI